MHKSIEIVSVLAEDRKLTYNMVVSTDIVTNINKKCVNLKMNISVKIKNRLINTIIGIHFFIARGLDCLSK